jgi:ribonuclease-3
MPSLERLQSRLGIIFNDQRLLESALVHRSFVHEHPEQTVGLADAERLEFLGDSILTYLSAAMLFARYPDRGEGELTGLRSALVKTQTLAGFARDLGLGWYIRLSKGDDRSGGRERDALLADTFEALVAAIYLDQGIAVATAFAGRFFEQQLAWIEQHGLALDYKSQLQQRVQAERNITPRYRLVAEIGQDPKREYTVEVLAGEERLGAGAGPSKQAAQQAAARAALETLEMRD